MARPMPSRGTFGGGGGLGGGSGLGLHPGMYRRHPAIYFMPRPGMYGRGGLGGGPSGTSSGAAAVAEAPTINSDAKAEEGAENEDPRVVEMTELVAAHDGTSPHGLSGRRGTRVVDPITYYAALTGAYGLIVYRTRQHRGSSNNDKHSNLDRSSATTSAPLGPGISVGSLTLRLDVPDRTDPSNVLQRIRTLARGASTKSRSGVQQLVSDVALELLREESNGSVAAAASSYEHGTSEGGAERTYHRWSTVARAKYDRETVNRWNGKDGDGLEEVVEEESGGVPADAGKATAAVVTILYQIEGDQTKMPAISSRADVRQALLRLAADAQVEECLLGAEVLWTPDGERDESLTERDAAALYPELRIL